MCQSENPQPCKGQHLAIENLAELAVPDVSDEEINLDGGQGNALALVAGQKDLFEIANPFILKLIHE